MKHDVKGGEVGDGADVCDAIATRGGNGADDQKKKNRNENKKAFVP